jgi:hypothetical protein
VKLSAADQFFSRWYTATNPISIERSARRIERMVASGIYSSPAQAAQALADNPSLGAVWDA